MLVDVSGNYRREYFLYIFDMICNSVIEFGEVVVDMCTDKQT